jgi:hypothetical protein
MGEPRELMRSARILEWRCAKYDIEPADLGVFRVLLLAFIVELFVLVAVAALWERAV